MWSVDTPLTPFSLVPAPYLADVRQANHLQDTRVFVNVSALLQMYLHLHLQMYLWQTCANCVAFAPKLR